MHRRATVSRTKLDTASIPSVVVSMTNMCEKSQTFMSPYCWTTMEMPLLSAKMSKKIPNKPLALQSETGISSFHNSITHIIAREASAEHEVFESTVVAFKNKLPFSYTHLKTTWNQTHQISGWVPLKGAFLRPQVVFQESRDSFPKGRSVHSQQYVECRSVISFQTMTPWSSSTTLRPMRP